MYLLGLVFSTLLISLLEIAGAHTWNINKQFPPPQLLTTAAIPFGALYDV